LLEKVRKRNGRRIRVRKHLKGTKEKPRLSVTKSNRHISVQLIDDENGLTLASASTLMKGLRSKNLSKSKDGARKIGSKIAELAKEKSISTVVFDRGHHKYHGAIAELATAAREHGLQF
jgi:large subunit ribosomal protein L18